MKYIRSTEDFAAAHSSCIIPGLADSSCVRTKHAVLGDSRGNRVSSVRVRHTKPFDFKIKTESECTHLKREILFSGKINYMAGICSNIKQIQRSERRFKIHCFP